MEIVISLLCIGALLLVIDCLGDWKRPVEESVAYREALTGMIREPSAPAHLAHQFRFEPEPAIEPADPAPVPVTTLNPSRNPV